jgi:exosortase/archaeosortase family protein
MTGMTVGILTNPIANRSPIAFFLRTLAWSFGLFAVFRAAPVEGYLVLPLMELQKGIAAWYGATGPDSVVVSVECSGTDVIALLIGAILAFPAPWGARLQGAAGGVAMILAVNTVRIGALWNAADSPILFDRLHRYVWPAILVVLAAGYALAWMRSAASGRPSTGDRGVPRSVRRFGITAGAFLGLFAAAAPWIMDSPVILWLAVRVTHAAAALLGAFGVAASASGNVLSTAHGAFLVSPDCVATPAVALYLAAALTLTHRPLPCGLALLATAPVFAALGVVRTMLVVLPVSLVGSPLPVVHSFYQVLAGGLAAAVTALWLSGDDQRRPGGMRRPVVLGAALGSGVTLAGIVVYGHLLAWGASAPWWPYTLVGPLEPGNVQGALRLLPGYQLGLLAALGVVAFPRLGWRRLGAALGILVVSQLALFAALGELAARFGITAHPLLVRGWALVEPVLLVTLLVRGGARGRPTGLEEAAHPSRKHLTAGPGITA